MKDMALRSNNGFVQMLLLLVFVMLAQGADAQRLLSDIMDSTLLQDKQIKISSDKYGILTFSGYMQPQFQVAQEKGANTEYQGGTFAANSSNRFRLRRGRLRADYISFHPNGTPATYFVFQFDGTEQGVNIRDFWGRYYENKWQMLAITAGVMARPFGFEVQLSSSARETPERGRMSQILMKTERDLGVELTFNPRKKDAKLKNFQFKLGVFNGQGLAGPREFDNRKDLIAHAQLKPVKWNNFKIGGGLSLLAGGIASETAKMFGMKEEDGVWRMTGDSAAANIGKIAPRRYLGADVQVEFNSNSNWETELRAEYIAGSQTGTEKSSATPGTYPAEGNVKQPLYTRPFNGAYFYLLQNLFNKNNQLVFKYDWYDPNSKVNGKHITAANGFSAADMRFSTFGVGFLRRLNDNLKIVLWYDRIRNEHTAIKGFEQDLRDDVFTIRTQFMF